MSELLIAFGILALLLTLSALVSRVVELAPISFPIIFLSLGIILGPYGFGLIAADIHSPVLEAIALPTLALVLFLDALKLRFDEGREAWLVPALILGPGTLLIVLLVAAAARGILGLPVAQALLVGAILASTDPVALRDIVRNEHIPRSIRRILSIEAGTNDLVVLPIVLVLIAVAQANTRGPEDWAVLLTKLFLVGPIVGFAIGALGAWLMSKADARMGIRREYQALYGLGLVLAAFVAGETLGVDGFLAAFAAGFAASVLDYELCDCFLEYGETTAEMAMLLSFILFGAVLSTSIGSGAVVPGLLLAALALFIIRPLSLGVVLLGASMSKDARAFIGWFGPRGLSSLLLVLLAVRGGVPEAEGLLASVGVVVLVSVVLHGVSATPLSSWYARRVAETTLEEERTPTAGGLFGETTGDVPRITVEQLAHAMTSYTPPIILDVRTRSSYQEDTRGIPGSQRVLPDQIREWMAQHEPDGRMVVLYCA